MTTKTTAVYGTDLLPHRMNPGKEAKVRRLLAAWRQVAVAPGREQWKLFFTSGHPNKRHDVSRTGYDVLGTSYGQMVRWQVVGQIESWLSNRQNEFRAAVHRSSLSPEIRHQLHFINSWQAWYDPKVLSMKDGSVIPVETRRLARGIMRHLLSKHRKPDFARVSMMIDQRCIHLTSANRASSFPLWARLSTLDKGRRINIPLVSYPYFGQRQGRRALSMQVMEREGEIVVGVMTDVAETFAAIRDAYRPRREAMALDLGLKTLFATNEGDLLGQGWLGRLRHYDSRITRLAAYRQRHGMKPRSERYTRYVAQLKGFVKSEVGRILNRLVKTHAPAEIVVEKLNFRNPNLSKRLNRILSKFGKKAVADKLKDLNDRFGIVITEVNPAYSSQEDSGCGYVAQNNRPRQAHFHCRWCGASRHADVNAAKVILNRRSDSAVGDVWRPKQAILGELVRRFSERFHRLRGEPPDPRLSNPHFGGWKAAVTSNARSG